MKPGRDWSIWPTYGIDDWMNCITRWPYGQPFPEVLRDSEGNRRKHLGSVFYIKAWGTKGYK